MTVFRPFTPPPPIGKHRFSTVSRLKIIDFRPFSTVFKKAQKQRSRPFPSFKKSFPPSKTPFPTVFDRFQAQKHCFRPFSTVSKLKNTIFDRLRPFPSSKTPFSTVSRLKTPFSDLKNTIFDRFRPQKHHFRAQKHHFQPFPTSKTPISTISGLKTPFSTVSRLKNTIFDRFQAQKHRFRPQKHHFRPFPTVSDLKNTVSGLKNTVFDRFQAQKHHFRAQKHRFRPPNHPPAPRFPVRHPRIDPRGHMRKRALGPFFGRFRAQKRGLGALFLVSEAHRELPDLRLEVFEEGYGVGIDAGGFFLGVLLGKSGMPVVMVQK
jgi:hypothetical protein